LCYLFLVPPVFVYRYCYCNQVSFGEMVGCDNDNCESGEWFHYPCVGLTEEPAGKWYCFECRINMEGKDGEEL
jgi:hypothetical protein